MIKLVDKMQLTNRWKFVLAMIWAAGSFTGIYLWSKVNSKMEKYMSIHFLIMRQLCRLLPKKD